MASIYTRNERLKEQILKPENCHCTYRKIIGANTATAFCSTDHSVKANLVWFHKESSTRIVIRLPFGSSYTKVVKSTAGLPAIDAAILSLFLKMDDDWHEAGNTDHEHTDHT